MTSNHEWRIDQLKFLFQIGLCEASNTGVELVGEAINSIINFFF